MWRKPCCAHMKLSASSAIAVALCRMMQPVSMCLASECKVRRHVLNALLSYANLLRSLRLRHGFGFAPASVSFRALRLLHRRQHGRPLLFLSTFSLALRSSLHAIC